jgi:hypothetical protein
MFLPQLYLNMIAINATLKLTLFYGANRENIKTDVLTTQKIAYYSMSPVARLIEEFQE